MILSTYTYRDKQIHHVKFANHAALTFGMARPQEYAEHINFKGQFLTWDEFLVNMGKLNETEDYFSTLYGVNMPGRIFVMWHENVSHRIQYERDVMKLLSSAPGRLVDSYLIGSIAGDEDTLDHEIAHGMYAISKEYRDTMDKLIHRLPYDLHINLEKYLAKRDYHHDVYNDEKQAFLATSSAQELAEDFNIDALWAMEIKSYFAKEKKNLSKDF